MCGPAVSKAKDKIKSSGASQLAGRGVREGLENKEKLGASKVFFPEEYDLSPSPSEMTNAEKAAAIQKLFGAGTYESRAREALPGILERLRMQEMAQLQNVPTLGLLPTMQGGQVGGMGQMAMPQQGLLQSLATQGMSQIASGQAMNPTILKAKG